MRKNDKNGSNLRKSAFSCAIVAATVATLLAGSAQVGSFAEAATSASFQASGTQRLVGGYALLSNRLGLVGNNKSGRTDRLHLFQAEEGAPNVVTFVEEPTGDGTYVEEFHGDGTYVEEFHGDGTQTDVTDAGDNVVVIGDGGSGDGVEVVAPDEVVVPDGSGDDTEKNEGHTYEWPVSLTQSVNDSEGNTYTVSVTFGEDAGIPHGAGLKISALDARAIA